MEDFIDRSEKGYNRQDPKALPVLGLALAIFVTIALVFVFVTAYYGWALEVEQQRFQMVPVAQDLKNVNNAESKALHQARWIDQSKGVVNLTVQQAMDLVLADAQQKKTWYSTKPMPVPPPPAAAPKQEAPAPPAAETNVKH